MPSKKKLSGSKPLQFSGVGETSLLFVYFEIWHYNSSSTRFLPFSTSSNRRVPLSEHICTHMFRIVPSSLADMWAPHVSFFLNLQSSRGSLWARPPLRPWRRSMGATTAARDLPKAKWPVGAVLWRAEAASSPLPSPSCGGRIDS
jgi:hypothetical protein